MLGFGFTANFESISVFLYMLAKQINDRTLNSDKLSRVSKYVENADPPHIMHKLSLFLDIVYQYITLIKVIRHDFQ